MTDKQKVLIIEDDPSFAKTLEVFLTKIGYDVSSAARAESGLKEASHFLPQLILLDYRLPDARGDEILQQLRQIASRPAIILMTGFTDIRTAVKVMKMGAYDYITKPVNPDELKLLLAEALKLAYDAGSGGRSEPGSKAKPARQAVEKNKYVIGNSVQSGLLHQHIKLVAPTQMAVLILGESGTGKEYVAKAIHDQSARSSAPFIAVDCGALSEELALSELFGHIKGSFTGAIADKKGQFIAATGGTLFLDEVGNLSYEVQMKLLRALQELVIQPLGSNDFLKTDVRIITATNENLLDRVRDGDFREDLYHRINEFKIQVPALVERKDDFWEFVDFFRANANEELGRTVTEFSPEVSAIFEAYSWPGNLRELRNVLRRSILLTIESDRVGIDTLPDEMKAPKAQAGKPGALSANPYDLKANKEHSEREMIIKTLKEARYNKSKAARILNIDRKTLYLKITKYGIDA